MWFLRCPKSAAIVHPERVSITETIAQLSGTIEHLFVKVGDRVKSGQVILADEPTGNLDSRSGDEVFNIMREMNREKGVAFIMVTHDDRLAQEADRILAIEDGWVHEVNKRAHRMKLLSSLSDS